MKSWEVGNVDLEMEVLECMSKWMGYDVRALEDSLERTYAGLKCDMDHPINYEN